MKKIINYFTTKCGFFLLYKKRYLEIGKNFRYYQDLNAIVYKKKIIAENVVIYVKLEDGLFVKSEQATYFFSNLGQEVAYTQFLLGYEVSWSEKPLKYYNLDGLEEPSEFGSLLGEYNEPKALKRACNDGYYIYRADKENVFLDIHLNVILSSEFRLVRYGDIVVYKSKIVGMFFETFSLLKNRHIQTIDFQHLENSCRYLIPLREKIEEGIEEFLKFQAVAVYDFCHCKTYKWTADSSHELYDDELNLIVRNINLTEMMERGFVEIYPQGYVTTNKDSSFFATFDNNIVLNARWRINVHNGVLSVLQNYKGRFFYDIYSIKDGTYIGKILTRFIYGKPKTIENVLHCEVLDTEYGVRFTLNDGRFSFYSKYGEPISYAQGIIL